MTLEGILLGVILAAGRVNLESRERKDSIERPVVRTLVLGEDDLQNITYGGAASVVRRVTLGSVQATFSDRVPRLLLCCWVPRWLTVLMTDRRGAW